MAYYMYMLLHVHVAKNIFFVNPFMPNGISHHYQLDESFSNIRVVG